MENRTYCVAQSLAKRVGSAVVYRTGDVTTAELRRISIEVFAEDLTYDEATALAKLMNYERG